MNLHLATCCNYLDIAKNNEGIFEKTKKLILELIVCRNLTDVVSMTEDTFKREFQADACKVLFFKENNNIPRGQNY